jgi:nitrite reductase/ring-hydroxylating ferredoxin subunit
MREPEPDWLEFASSRDLREKKTIVKWIGNQEVALSVHDGTIRAFCNVCPHKGGPLHEGRWSSAGTVQCPWHGYVFDLSTGECLSRPGLRVRLFRWTERAGKILVALHDPAS